MNAAADRNAWNIDEGPGARLSEVLAEILASGGDQAPREKKGDLAAAVRFRAVNASVQLR
ncbi:MAG: hypothetical protein ACI4MF_04950 [Candidatus Faecivicinus sp.]